MYSDGSLFDWRAKISTSRKPMVKLAKQQGKPPQQKLREKIQSPKPSIPPPAITQMGTVITCSALTGTQFVCFFQWLSGQQNFCRTQFVHLHISELTPGPSGTQSRQPAPQKRSSGAAIAGIVKNFSVCLSNSPSEIWPYIYFVSYPAGSYPRKGNAKPQPILTARRRPLQTETP